MVAFLRVTTVSQSPSTRVRVRQVHPGCPDPVAPLNERGGRTRSVSREVTTDDVTLRFGRALSRHRLNDTSRNLRRDDLRKTQVGGRQQTLVFV